MGRATAQRQDVEPDDTFRIAHDVKNLAALAAVCLYEIEAAPVEEARERLSDISVAVKRIANLANDLLCAAKSRSGVAQTDANALIRRIEGRIARVLGAAGLLVIRLAPGPLPVCMDGAELEQILLNLAQHARDAMPLGGELRIATQPLPADLLLDPTAVLAPDGYVVITVSDTGYGMDRSTVERVFEPVHGREERDGAGLATVREAMKALHGHVAVESLPGLGTTFRLHIPRAASHPNPMGPITCDAKCNGDESVVIIDPDPRTRRAFATVLTKHGYRVRERSTGADALAAFAAEGAPPIVVLDLAIIANEGAFCESLRNRYPTMRLLVLSGFPAVEVAGLQPEDLVLPKPVTAAQFAMAVRNVLDA